MLKINKTGLHFAKLDASNKLIRGQWVIALGNPHNLFSVSNMLILINQPYIERKVKKYLKKYE